MVIKGKEVGVLEKRCCQSKRVGTCRSCEGRVNSVRILPFFRHVGYSVATDTYRLQKRGVKVIIFVTKILKFNKYKLFAYCVQDC